MKTLNSALCENRHDIPLATDGAIFPMQIDPTNLDAMAEIVSNKLADAKAVNLYVAGLTPALLEVIKYCHAHNIGLKRWHYNKETGSYFVQQVVYPLPVCPYCGTPIPHTANYCPGCGDQ